MQDIYSSLPRLTCDNFAEICLFGIIPTAGTCRQSNVEEKADISAAAEVECTAAAEEEGTAETVGSAAADEGGIAAVEEEGNVGSAAADEEGSVADG